MATLPLAGQPIPFGHGAGMNGRTLVDQGRDQQAVSRSPIFLAFANWVGLFPRQAAYAGYQPLNLADLNLRIAGLGLQGIQHQAGKPAASRPSGR